MRDFYIFQINNDMQKIMRDTPYDLYKALETIYYDCTDDPSLGYACVHQLILPIETKEVDIHLFRKYKDNYFYTKYRNIHHMHDVYRKENTSLTIKKTYLKLETDSLKPKFLEVLQKNHNYFVCDFEGKDYFWLDNLFESV